MIPTFQEISVSLYAAYRLARFDASGMAFFGASTEAAWRSFFAAVLVAPFYAALLAFRYMGMGEELDTLQFAAAEAIGYVISWTAYPVLMASVTQILGCRQRLIGYITVYNWSMVLQNAVFLPIGLLSVTNVLPEQAAGFLWLVAMVLVLAYLWFIARTALMISAFSALAVVVLDLVLSFLINAVTAVMY